MSIAIVLSISGQAWARDASGNLRELSVGDTLREGETVVASQGGGVELDFGDNTAPALIQDGEQVVLTPELHAEEPLEPSEFAALDQDIEALLAALDDDTIDLLDVLDATAAGAGGGGAADGGHNFVRLARVAESTGEQSFEFGNVSVTDLPVVEEAGAVPQEPLVELPSEPLNAVPTALDDFFSTDEESLLSGVNVLDNDSDPDGDALSISDPGSREVTFIGPNGLVFTATVVLGADGFLSLDPRGGFDALALGEQASGTFTYTVTDGRGGFSTAKVTLTIVGTNDQPIIGGVASGEVTEDGTTTTTGQLTVSDVDVSDTHTWSVVGANVGTYGSFSVDANGQWTYVLDNASPAVQGLITGQSVSDSFTVEVSDGNGGTATQVVTVTIHGSDDGAVISGQDSGLVKEDEILSTGGKLDVSDPDAGQAVFVAQASTAGSYGTFTLGTDGTWSYVLNNAHVSVQGLAVNETLSESFTVVTADGTTSSVTVTIQGTNDQPIIGGVASGEVTEDATLQTSGQLTVSDVDTSDTHTWSVVGANVGTYGSFSVDANGQWTYVLDNASPAVQGLITGQSVSDSFTVEVSDGNGGTATQVVTVTIHGTSDQAQVIVSATGVDSTVYEAGLISVENTSETASGSFQVSATDGIAHVTVDGQTFSLAQLQGFSSGSPSAAIVTDMGTLYLTGYSGTANVGTITYQYTLKEVQAHGSQGSATDGVLTDTIVVVVKGVGDSAMTGHLTIAIVDDVPQAVNDNGGTVTEDAVQNVLSGNVLSNDSFGADGPAGGAATVSWNVSSAQLADIGQYGTLVLNTDGSWSFTLDNSLAKVQALKASDLLTFNLGYTITDADGDRASATLGFSIQGTDDSASVIVSTGGADSTVYEAGLTSAADTRETAGGSFQISASDGIATLNVMGQVFTLAQLQGFNESSPSVGIVTSMGTLYLTGFSGTATAGTVSYQYTLSAAQSHGAPGTATNDVLTDSISLSVNGVGGSTASGTLSVAIIDDAPVTNVTNAVSVNAIGASFTGSLADIGADYPGKVVFSGTPPAGLTSGGKAVTYQVSGDGSVLTASAGGQVVFTLTGHPNGTYTFQQYQPLDLSILNSTLQGSVGASGPQPAYYIYEDGTFGSSATAKAWSVKITGSGNINPSTQGMGVGNNIFDTGEKMRIDFDNEGASGKANLAYVAKIGINDISGNETVNYTAMLSDGTTVSGIARVTNLVDGNLFITAKLGTYIDYIDLMPGSSTTVRITSISTFSMDDSAPKNLGFGFTVTDADGDSASGSLGIVVQNGQVVNGDAGNNVLFGGAGAQVLSGGDGNDILIGGAGNDTLIGGEGDDVFQWNFGDQGGVGSAARDVVKDFSLGSNTLDLADLLQGEAAGTIDSFIFAAQEGSSTVLYVNHEGSIGANGSNATQVIVLENFNMNDQGSAEFLKGLLDSGQLHIDQ
ncbi:retention module-containing protein [Halomonas sp. MCCC 1A11062]|uniref:retention module-containing protein n=1 Tax=Halomonas sp. MCCC 1A11062 TaxID=2733485 RepID=UPI001F43CE06|nr:retention module-containing protein [Halomonas sp. MCCC 1A11062]MCE8040284.1 retention module-containing protein [Halomonas sp. MCCC 1A11062]